MRGEEGCPRRTGRLPPLCSRSLCLRGARATCVRKASRVKGPHTSPGLSPSLRQPLLAHLGSGCWLRSRERRATPVSGSPAEWMEDRNGHDPSPPRTLPCSSGSPHSPDFQLRGRACPGFQYPIHGHPVCSVSCPPVTPPLRDHPRGCDQQSCIMGNIPTAQDGPVLKNDWFFLCNPSSPGCPVLSWQPHALLLLVAIL